MLPYGGGGGGKGGGLPAGMFRDVATNLVPSAEEAIEVYSWRVGASSDGAHEAPESVER